jgi:hypothetical protein
MQSPIPQASGKGLCLPGFSPTAKSFVTKEAANIGAAITAKRRKDVHTSIALRRTIRKLPSILRDGLITSKNRRKV